LLGALFFKELHPETKHGGNAGGPSGKFCHTGSLATDNLSVATATAESTGKGERTIRRVAARGEALGDDLGTVTGTSLDKGVELELDALAKLPKDERKGLIDRAKAGERVTDVFFVGQRLLRSPKYGASGVQSGVEHLGL
jgi:hypothetical protein